MAKDDKTAEKKKGPEVSPRGIAAYTFIYKKDTKFAKTEADAKYKASLVLDKDGPGVEKFVASIRADHEANEGRAKTCPVKDGDEMLDKDGKQKEEFADKCVVQFKTRYQPALVDSRKTPLPEDVKVFPGDEIRCAFTRIPYDTGATSGVSLRLGAIMLLAKNAGGANADAFEAEEDGYVTKASSSDSGSGDSTGDNGGDY